MLALVLEDSVYTHMEVEMLDYNYEEVLTIGQFWGFPN